MKATGPETVILIMSGEPVSSWEPLVMNSHQKNQQVYMDFGNGVFGDMD